MRYLYIKNGDVVTQLMGVFPPGKGVPTSGPDAFIADFLRSIESHPTLLMSFHDRNSSHRVLGKAGRVFLYTARSLGAFFKVLIRAVALCKALFLALRFKPDRILCGAHGPPLWLSSLLSMLCSAPVVHSSHNSLFSSDLSLYRRALTAIDLWCIRRAGAVVCHGPYIRQQLLDLGLPGNRVFEFDIGFQDMLEKTGSNGRLRQLDDTDGTRLVVFVGRIERDKGIFDLLAACGPMLRHDPRTKLVFVGKGSQLEKLREQAQELDLTNQVLLLGEVDHSTVASAMRKARVVVTPTRSSFPEARCMAAMESIFLGVPVVAPDSGPFPYLIKHGENGLLFKTDSVPTLRSSVLRVLEDDVLHQRLCAGARRTGERLLTPPLTFSQAVGHAFSVSVP